MQARQTAALSLATLLGVVTATAIAAPIVPEPFAVVVPRVRQQTEVPLIPVPTEVPFEAYLPSNNPSIFPSQLQAQLQPQPPQPRTYYVSIANVLHDRFLLGLAVQQSCRSPHCTFGSISGQVLPEYMDEPREYRTAVATADISYGRPSPEPPALVTLHGGIQGWFVPYKCPHAGCTESKVIWFDAGHRYEVGLRKGMRADVVALANSALQNLEQADEP